MRSTGDNVETLPSNILTYLKFIPKLILMSPDQVWSYQFMSEKPYKLKLVS